MKILFCASEAVPFAKTGGLADVAGALPLALEGLGQEVILAMPRYKAISDSKFKLRRLSADIAYTIIGKNIKVYFIENDKYFGRDGLYQDKNGDYPDNLDRFGYYCKRVLSLLKEIDFHPEIIHCHDWQTGLIPVYLKSIYAEGPFYKNIKTIFTIHNIGYQGLFPKEQFTRTGLDWGLFNIEGLEFYNQINILKGGMIFSDLITTVSPTYSKEIQTKKFGFGLEGVLAGRKEFIYGILNGLDYSIWDPQSDKFIARNFSRDTIKDKIENKKQLQIISKLAPKKDVPLLGIVSRLAEQKGFDILAEGLEEICKMNLQLVILGTGDLKYHLILEKAAKKYPRVFSLYLKFDDPLAHKIYAGSDIFLMPSKYEPCGLGQMISLRYGTIPLVFKTGGLADTISQDNGFIFSRYRKEDLIKAIKQACTAFKHPHQWQQRVSQAMGDNFSWEESAKKYVRVYEKAKSL